MNLDWDSQNHLLIFLVQSIGTGPNVSVAAVNFWGKKHGKKWKTDQRNFKPAVEDEPERIMWFKEWQHSVALF